MTLFKRHSKIFALCLVLVMVFTIGAISVSAKELINHDGDAVACASIHNHANREYVKATTTYVDYNSSTQKSTPVYHYSRARLEQDILFWTNVIIDTDRQWDEDGDGVSSANTLYDTSEKCGSNEYIARTYYGK